MRFFVVPTMLLALAACAQQSDRITAPVAAVEPTGDAERLALTLASAERHAASDELDALRAALRRIDALGAQAADDSQDDPLVGWRERAGQTEAPFRGRTLGPAYRRGTLKPAAQLQLKQLFLSGKTASLAVSSPAGSGIELSVATEKGKAICANRTSCRWTPIFTERYAITLRNRTTENRAYYLVVD